MLLVMQGGAVKPQDTLVLCIETRQRWSGGGGGAEGYCSSFSTLAVTGHAHLSFSLSVFLFASLQTLVLFIISLSVSYHPACPFCFTLSSLPFFFTNSPAANAFFRPVIVVL